MRKFIEINNFDAVRTLTDCRQSFSCLIYIEEMPTNSRRDIYAQ